MGIDSVGPLTGVPELGRRKRGRLSFIANRLADLNFLCEPWQRNISISIYRRGTSVAPVLIAISNFRNITAQ